MSVVRRTPGGQFAKGSTGNPAGRLPRQTETEYLNVTMEKVSVDKWAEIIQMAADDAISENPHVRARAREWLSRYLIGEPSQMHQFLYKEERDIHITVTFGDNGGHKELVDVIDGESHLLSDETD